MDSFFRKQLENRDHVIMALLGAVYLVLVIGTIAQNEFLIRFFSPVTVCMTAGFIISCFSRMGRFKIPTVVLAAGIGAWGLADIIRFINEFALHKEPLSDLVRTLYLVPNYCFGLALVLYLVIKLDRKEIYRLAINTFVVTVISCVLLSKYLYIVSADSMLEWYTALRVLLYLFINFFILILAVQLVLMVGKDIVAHRIGLMVFGIIGYIVLDFEYTYSEALGKEPENPYMDLIYILYMILIAVGVYGQALRQLNIKLRKHTYSQKAIRRSGYLTLAGIALDLIGLIVGFLDQPEFFYILIALLGYWMMNTIFQNNALSEQLLKQRDMLTGLYNRGYSSSVLAESCRLADDNGSRFAVYSVDLNHFKPVNDTYGHEMGDKVLHEFGVRMLELPEGWVSFRTGGDEFMVIRRGVYSDDEISEATKKLQELFNTPIQVDSYIFRLSGSIGVSVYPQDAVEPEMLVRYADTAMYQVKTSTKKDGFKYFDKSLVNRVENYRSLEEKLQSADPEKDFVLYYQPQFSPSNGRLVGVEAFPRLAGKEYDDVPATELIMMAESVGIMSRLGRWIAKEAISQLDLWNHALYHDLKMSINLAPLQLLDTEYLEELETITKKLKIKPECINFDVQNEVLMGVDSTAKDALMRMHEYGFELSLNDFGGGDVNLSYILDCGFSNIHISRKLIENSTRDLDVQTLIKTIVAIGNEMAISVSAVGVETETQADLLRSLGIRQMQGFYFGKPVDKETFMKKYLID